MNKKVYQEPRTIIVYVQTQQIIASTIMEAKTNAGITYGGGGSGAALSRGGDWDDDDE